MKTGLQLRTGQNLTLTPQLQQSIRLLQLSGLELHEALQQMMETNPFLEPDVDDFDPNETSLEAPPQTDSEPNDDEWLNTQIPTDTCTLLSDEQPNSGSNQEASGIDNWSENINSGERHLSSDTRQEHNSSNSELQVTGDDTGWSGEAEASFASSNDERETTTDSDAQSESLYDYLHRQSLSLRLEDTDRMALYCLIESLNEDGYLEDSLGEVAEVLLHQMTASGLSVDDSISRDEVQFELLHHLTVALRLLHTLEPVGVGARDLGECLRLQLKALHIEDDEIEQLLAREVALSLCQQPPQYLARRDVRNLQKITGFSTEQIQIAMQLIATLEPKPGRRFSTLQHHLVVPDVLVERNEKTGQWSVRINPTVLPRVRVQEMYAQALRNSPSNNGLQQHLQEARWMIKSIQQRFDTILRVSKAIVQHQADFFAHGVQSMQPLILSTIADELEMHESTISRVSNAKYMTTPWGTFELKFFFSSALETEDGSASSTAVRALLQELIAQEPSQKPLSDSKLSELLKAQGIQCARRTVAKYREALQIPPAHLRRDLQG